MRATNVLRGLGLLLVAGLAACSDDNATAPAASSMIRAPANDSLVRPVRQLTAGRGITQLRAAPRVRPALVRLGRALAFDRELSGNRDIACMTCHLPAFATGDGRSLSVGQGADGMGPARIHPDGKFIPRNAPPLFNLHAMGPLFWDGRITRDASGNFHTRDGSGGLDDFGRMRVTGLAADRYAFRTPALRNVELTAPYGHDGAIVDLRAFVDHYSESEPKLHAFDVLQLEPLLQSTLLGTADAIMATRDTLLNGVVFPAQTIDEVTAFMGALTDPEARHLDRVVPHRVPSGLPVDGVPDRYDDGRNRDYDWDD